MSPLPHRKCEPNIAPGIQTEPNVHLLCVSLGITAAFLSFRQLPSMKLEAKDFPPNLYASVVLICHWNREYSYTKDLGNTANVNNNANNKNLNLRGLGTDGSLEVINPVCIIPRQIVKGVRPALPGDCQNKTLKG